FHALDVVLVVRQHRDDEEDARDEVARDVDDVTRVLRREPRRIPIELEVARTAVDHPARGAAGAGSPVAFLEDEHGEPAERQVAGDAGARDPTADDDDVVRARGGHGADVSGPTLPLRAASGTLR